MGGFHQIHDSHKMDLNNEADLDGLCDVVLSSLYNINSSMVFRTTFLVSYAKTSMFMFLQAMKVVGVKAHTENEKGQVLLDVYIR